MAQLKQLSAGSSQIIMMMFRDKNNAPIKADSVHVKGSIFTGSGKPFEFEVNKGVCTNCKIQNDMLLFNIVPLLGLGQMQVYTQTFLGDAKAITGTYISENQQKLGVEVVQKGTFLSDRQGAMWVDVYLPIEINDAAQIPWVPAGADEQWIKDYLDKNHLKQQRSEVWMERFALHKLETDKHPMATKCTRLIYPLFREKMRREYWLC